MKLITNLVNQALLATLLFVLAGIGFASVADAGTVSDRDEKYFKVLLERANTDPKAAKELAYRLIKGVRIKRDPGEGLKYMARAAELGDEEAVRFIEKLCNNKKIAMKVVGAETICSDSNPVGTQAPWTQIKKIFIAKNRASLGKLTGHGVGTGFAISSDGYFVTNEHVGGGCDRIIIEQNGYSSWARMIATNEALDLAVLKVEESTPAYLAIRVKEAVIGEPVTVGGFPTSGMEGVRSSFTITTGVVGTIRELDSVRLIQMSAAIASGNSGGPAVDKYGAVIGVAVGKMQAGRRKSGGFVGDQYNFAVSGGHLRQFLNESSVKFTSRIKMKLLSSEMLSQRILAAAAQVYCLKRKN